jgi:peptidoglycan hydrolase-like protein with peptidoglycan-binding domain
MQSLVIVAAALVSLGIAACGGGDDSGSADAVDTGTVIVTQETTPPEATVEQAAEPPLQLKVPTSAPIGPTSPAKVIRRLQTALALLGYNVGQPDGIWGQKTRKAVVAFQKKLKLETDGLVGAKTARTINKELREQAGA